jgi:hypothetical protein
MTRTNGLESGAYQRGSMLLGTAGTSSTIDLIAQGIRIEADMFIECAHPGLGIEERAIDYGQRADRPKVSSISDGLKIASLSLKRWMAPSGRRAL